MILHGSQHGFRKQSVVNATGLVYLYCKTIIYSFIYFSIILLYSCAYSIKILKWYTIFTSTLVTLIISPIVLESLVLNAKWTYVLTFNTSQTLLIISFYQLGHFFCWCYTRRVEQLSAWLWLFFSDLCSACFALYFQYNTQFLYIFYFILFCRVGNLSRVF